ncbi:helix-turn-helix transcriptional regulator [Rossellomorea marisflavi]|uniref:helix-turn-helix transcriptional regulator n=1 Tax=Rossellomorea marisflavi TaxID=189381 RepID=UPI00345D8B12
MENNLANIRKQKSITQQQLAELVGCTREQISQIENSRRSGSYKLLSRIAKHLGVSVTDIFLT